jgi:hypothetical protein
MKTLEARETKTEEDASNPGPVPNPGSDEHSSSTCLLHAPTRSVAQ